MTTARIIEKFLAQPAIAVVGVSRSGGKFGNTAWRTLQEKGYRVYQVNSHVGTSTGPCYRRLADLPEEVASVLVVVPARDALEVILDAHRAGARYVWLQQGAESREATSLAATLKIELVAGECILMFAHPTGIHKMHRTVRRLLGGVVN
jgi:predicted CoA-binding protein